LSAQRDNAAGTIILAAAWFGLVTGLVEGAALLNFQNWDWLNWSMRRVAVAQPILWVSPAVDLVLFLAVASLLAILATLLPRLPWRQIGVFVYGWLMFTLWGLVSGRISAEGALMLALGLSAMLVRWYRKHEEATLRFWRRTLPVAAAALLVLVAVVEGGSALEERRKLAALPSAPAGQPNVLILVVDTLRADHLSLHGYSRQTSPALDALAKQGVVFDQAFATSSWTLPSHASLLTGTYPFQHGAEVLLFEKPLPTLTSVLFNRGYRTGAFSANLVYFTRKNGFAAGFTRFEDFFETPIDGFQRTVFGRRLFDHLLNRASEGNPPWRRGAKSMIGSLLEWVRADEARPFFAIVNCFDIHDPYLPPQPWRGKFSTHESPGGKINSLGGQGDPRLTPEELQRERDAYDGGIAYVDDQFGKLFAALESANLLANTIVIVTSDHGESFGERGYYHHRNDLYPEVIRVPLILHWPKQVPAGTRITQAVSIASIPATVMDLLGAEAPASFRVPSLVRLWREPASAEQWPWPLAELAHMPFRGIEKTPAFKGAMKSLISPQWQYIVHETLGEEIYNRQGDPGRMNNLAATEEGKKLAAEFAAKLEAMLGRKFPSGETKAEKQD
jgi:arylsulfatase A-like enzyme